MIKQMLGIIYRFLEEFMSAIIMILGVFALCLIVASCYHKGKTSKNKWTEDAVKETKMYKNKHYGSYRTLSRYEIKKMFYSDLIIVLREIRDELKELNKDK